jgi:hypothetical protein
VSPLFVKRIPSTYTTVLYAVVWYDRARQPRDGIQTFTDFKDSVSSVVVTDHEIIAR